MNKILKNFAEKILAFFINVETAVYMFDVSDMFPCSVAANDFWSAHTNKNAGWPFSCDLCVELSRYWGKNCHSFIQQYECVSSTGPSRNTEFQLFARWFKKN